MQARQASVPCGSAKASNSRVDTAKKFRAGRSAATRSWMETVAV